MSHSPLSNEPDATEHIISTGASAVLELGRSSLLLKKKLDFEREQEIYALIAQDEAELIKLFNKNEPEVRKLKKILSDRGSSDEGITLLSAYPIALLGSAHIYFQKKEIELMELSRLSARSSTRARRLDIKEILIFRFEILNLSLNGTLILTEGAFDEQCVSLPESTLSLLLGGSECMGDVFTEHDISELKEKRSKEYMVGMLKAGVVKEQIQAFKAQGVDLSVDDSLLDMLTTQAMTNRTGESGLRSAFLKHVYEVNTNDSQSSFPIRMTDSKKKVSPKRKRRS